MRLLPWLIVSCFGVAVLASARTGYLTAIGPSALRFQEPRSATPGRLLPLSKDRPALVTAASPVGVNATDATVVSQSPAPLVVSAPATITDEPAVTPEMLIQTFRRRTEGDHKSETTIVLPKDFVPPTPASKPSSSATYESP